MEQRKDCLLKGYHTEKVAACISTALTGRSEDEALAIIIYMGQNSQEISEK